MNHLVLVRHLSDLSQLVGGEPGAGQTDTQEHPEVDVQEPGAVRPLVERFVPPDAQDAIKDLVGVHRRWFLFEVLADELRQLHDGAPVVGVLAPSVRQRDFEGVVHNLLGLIELLSHGLDAFLQRCKLEEPRVEFSLELLGFLLEEPAVFVLPLDGTQQGSDGLPVFLDQAFGPNGRQIGLEGPGLAPKANGCVGLVVREGSGPATPLGVVLAFHADAGPDAVAEGAFGPHRCHAGRAVPPADGAAPLALEALLDAALAEDVVTLLDDPRIDGNR